MSKYIAHMVHQNYSEHLKEIVASDICDARRKIFEMIKEGYTSTSIPISCEILEIKDILSCDVEDWSKRIKNSEYDNEVKLKEQKECDELEEFRKKFDL